jgi:glutamine amidotransferase
MTVAIVQYNAGNIFSVSMALTRLGVPFVISDDPKVLTAASRVIFPGVGEAGSAMGFLRARGLDSVITDLRQPVLGICLGFQLMCQWSEESDTTCLGVFSAKARRFTADDAGERLKIPHIGWNVIADLSHPIFAGLPPSPYVYFVHSYKVDLSEQSIAMCRYGAQFSAAAACRNFVGVQFHPEKSGEVGGRIIKNFLEWKV